MTTVYKTLEHRNLQRLYLDSLDIRNLLLNSLFISIYGKKNRKITYVFAELLPIEEVLSYFGRIDA